MGVWRRLKRFSSGSLTRALPRELAWWVPSRRSRSQRIREGIGGLVAVGIGIAAPLAVTVVPQLPTVGVVALVLLVVPPLVVFFTIAPHERLPADTLVTDAGRTLGRFWAQVGAKTWFVTHDAVAARDTRPSGLRTDLDGFVLPIHASRARWPSASGVIARATDLLFRGLYLGCVLAIGGGLTLEVAVKYWDGSVGRALYIGMMAVLFSSMGLLAGLVFATLLQFVLHKCWFVVARRIDRWRRRPGPIVMVELQGRVLLVGEEGETRFHLDEPGRSVTLDRNAHRLELRNDRESVVLHGELGALDFLVQQVAQVRQRGDASARAQIPSAFQDLGLDQ